MANQRTPFTTSRYVSPPAVDDSPMSPLCLDDHPPRDRDDQGDYESFYANSGNFRQAPQTPGFYTSPGSTTSISDTGDLDLSAIDLTPLPEGYDPSDLDRAAPKRRGAHRIPAPPSALRGTVAIVAVAAGAVVSAGQSLISNDGSKTDSSETALAAHSQIPASLAGGASSAAIPAADGQPVADISSASSATSTPQVLSVATPIDMSGMTDQLAKGERLGEARAARDLAARVQYVLPTIGAFTSTFGSRWGEIHGGVDIANAIGTPIMAVAAGTVIDAGPASGFGMWVRLKHSDGTVTVYGHIDSALVTVGQQVKAGEQIARMGNRGQSTGPHLHFEVWLDGSTRTDPQPWLATRGISLGSEKS